MGTLTLDDVTVAHVVHGVSYATNYDGPSIITVDWSDVAVFHEPEPQPGPMDGETRCWGLLSFFWRSKGRCA